MKQNTFEPNALVRTKDHTNTQVMCIDNLTQSHILCMVCSHATELNWNLTTNSARMP